MKAIVCDKCGEVITDEEEMKDLLRLDFRTAYVGKFSETHLCDKCKDLLYKWIENK